ncbi:MAG: gamma-glutamyltransferase [Alphaproteobacteria bacterium]|nr:gamma-glutamyltransferase [Alphaproteobacteria bacterium]
MSRLIVPRRTVLAGGAALGLVGPSLAHTARAAFEAPVFDGSSRRLYPAESATGMVTSREAIAAHVGAQVLALGGNAVDAAIATGFALSVTLPQAGGIGGGGFMVAHLAEPGTTVAFDFREVAPAAARREMFLAADGSTDQERARYSHASAGVPGVVAGYAEALERWGTWPLASIMAPAIRLAREGFPASRWLIRDIDRSMPRFEKWPQSLAVMRKPDGSAWRLDDAFRQPDLANTLEAIARDGPQAFYEGPIAVAIAEEMRRHDGLIDEADLAAYRTVTRKPVWGRYLGLDIASMPPPSSGGAHLIQMLNILEGFHLGALGAGSAQTIHLMVEAMRRAYADRSRHVGDPAFYAVPLSGLIDKGYADVLRADIDPDRATPSELIGPGDAPSWSDGNTTHLSVMDRAGNAVALTTTLNFAFGTRIVAEGTGVFLNNEMNDFASAPDRPNAWGLVSGDANAVEPGKRPLSSMSPTLAFVDGRPVLATGARGGGQIITSVMQVILNMIEHRMNLAEATLAPRVHHQWRPDTLRMEPGFSPDTIERLAAMGHAVEPSGSLGTVQSVRRVEGGGYRGVSDPRRPGGTAVGVD